MNKYILVVDDDKICNFLTVNALKKAGVKGVAWDGVRNYQARNNLKKMTDKT